MIVLFFDIGFSYIIPLSLILLKILISYTLNYKTMKRLNVIDLYWLHPLYELINIIIQVFFVLLNVINKPTKWKR